MLEAREPLTEACAQETISSEWEAQLSGVAWVSDSLNFVPVVAVLRYLRGTEGQALAAHSHIQVQT